MTDAHTCSGKRKTCHHRYSAEEVKGLSGTSYDQTRTQDGVRVCIRSATRVQTE